MTKRNLHTTLKLASNIFSSLRVPHKFDSKFYTAYYPDLTHLKTEKDARDHWLRHGRYEGRIYYEEQITDKSTSKTNPAPDILITEKEKTKDEINYNRIMDSGLFSAEYYLAMNPDVRGEGLDPLSHYLKFGEIEGRRPHPLFCPKTYLQLNPDVKEAGLSPLHHYAEHGAYEERNVIKCLSEKPGQDEKIEESHSLVSAFLTESPAEPILNNSVDIIIPVYNGLNLLKRLLPSVIKNTSQSYRLIIIDDGSPEPDIFPWLQNWASKNKNILLLQNKKNRGFVYTCNKAFKIIKNNAVLLNTDTEVPPGWLGRLMEPIERYPEIASTTPFSNAATICSFPEMPRDNPLYLGQTTEAIDFQISKLSNLNISIPTGVGFCMGISKAAIDAIGGFDQDAFGKGYGEENDWCQRAKARGYRHTHVTNLFVQHDHGGSFSSSEKSELVKSNLGILNDRWPEYSSSVEDTLKIDAAKHHRMLAKALLICQTARTVELIIEHNFGGGTTEYRKRRIKTLLAEDSAAMVLTHNHDTKNYDIEIIGPEDSLFVESKTFTSSMELGAILKVKKIVVSSLVGFSSPLSRLKDILRLKHLLNVNLEVLFHDYFPICPSYTLIDWQGEYCKVPKGEECEKCSKKQIEFNNSDISIKKWRDTWGDFLKEAEELVVFSKSSKNILSSTYNLVPENVYIRPHSMKMVGLTPISTQKNDGILHIGIIGAINKQKGLDRIIEIAELMLERKLNEKITIFGWTALDDKLPENISVTGRFDLDNLKTLVESSGATVFLMPSIWPETFSYVTEELMMMELPFLAYDIGAQGEKATSYSKGYTTHINSSAEEVIELLTKIIKDKASDNS